MTPSTFSAVPIEVLRDFARAESERTSVRAVANEIGIGRTTFQNFVSHDTSPHPRIKRRLTLWYLERSARREREPASGSLTHALVVLAADLPMSSRDHVRAAIASVLTSVYAILGIPVPLELARIAEDSRTAHSHSAEEQRARLRD